MLDVAEHLRVVLSRWVRTTRDQARTPSSAKIETLRVLQDDGPATIVTLAHKRYVKHQSMRLVVEQLATEGAVNKDTDPADRRHQIVSITDNGRLTLKEDQRIRVRWIAQLLQGCTTKEVDEVVRALHTLEGLLEKGVTTPF